MAITASGTYWLTIEKFLILTGPVSWESTACKYALDTDADTPDFDLDDFRDDTSEVAAGGNYTAGGNALVAPALTISAGMKYDFNDPQWTSSTITAMAGFVCSGDATNTLLEVRLPSEEDRGPEVLPEGYYLLFVVDERPDGFHLPSAGAFVKVSFPRTILPRAGPRVPLSAPDRRGPRRRGPRR